MNSMKLSHRKCLVATAIALSLVVSLPLSALLISEVAAQTTHEVKITGFAFVPQNLTINPGTTITWNNTDPVIHTLWFVYLANESTYLLSDPIPPDTTWTRTFNDAVELQYYSFDKLWISGFINVTAGVHDVAVIDVSSLYPWVYQGQIDPIDVTVTNEGDFTETVDVYAFYDGNLTAPKQTTTLNPGQTKTLRFNWDTTGVPVGNYTISANATIPVDDDLSDNYLSDGTQEVKEPLPGVHDVAVTNVTVCCGATIVHGTYTARINVTVANEGDSTETFNVTTYWNTTEIQTIQVTLTNGTSTSNLFNWTTTGLTEYGYYNITAYAHLVPGETDLTDNTKTYGIVRIVHEGDVNNDEKVRVDDILAIALAFGDNCGDPGYNANLDVNCDLKIRVDDILAAALQFGYTKP